MKYIKNFWNWLVWSSADPEKLALTVRGALVVAVPVILNIVQTACGFGLVCLGIDAPGLNEVVNVIVAFVSAVATIVGCIMFVIGFLRKIILTVK